MRLLRIAILLVVGAAAVAGCGGERGASADASDRGAEPAAAAPAMVEVPDVIGESAAAASAALEAEGFDPGFSPEPDDPRLCTVANQDQSGEVEQGAEVMLTLECKVEVPDLSDEPADEAVRRLEKLGLTAGYEEEPRDPSLCTVEEQDVVGEAEPESEVVISVLCKLPDVTGKDLRSAVSTLRAIGYEAEHRFVRDMRACTVTSHRSEGEPGATVDLTVHCTRGG